MGVTRLGEGLSAGEEKERSNVDEKADLMGGDRVRARGGVGFGRRGANRGQQFEP